MTKVGILGATGAVGRQMLQCLWERNWPKEEIRLFASEKSCGRKIPYGSGELAVEAADSASFSGLDFVLGAVPVQLARQYRRPIADAGAVFIDNSSAFRLEDGVPLVVPEINGADALKHHGLIANPNCSTIIAMMALAPIASLSRIISVNACTYQAVSGAGMAGIEELSTQVEDVRRGRDVTVNVFPEQIAYNCIARIGSMTENGYTTEEMKMQNEGRKILHDPDLRVSCTCVRVPVFRSHSIALTAVTEKKLSLYEVRRALHESDGVVCMEQALPTPLAASNQDLVLVGRIREDLAAENGISLWCCGDQIRRGAASNAVEIMEYVCSHR